MQADDKYRRLALSRVWRMDIPYSKTAAMGGNHRRPFPYRDDRACLGHRRIVDRHFKRGNFWGAPARNHLASCAEARAHKTGQINHKTKAGIRRISCGQMPSRLAKIKDIVRSPAFQQEWQKLLLDAQKELTPLVISKPPRSRRVVSQSVSCRRRSR
jgi:hypothetical protein